jgi:hypothetical protein
MNELERLLPAAPGALVTLIKEGILRRYRNRALIISEGDIGYLG